MNASVQQSWTPRLLANHRPGCTVVLPEHMRYHGQLPEVAPTALIEMVADAGLRGRGGAWFPTGRKLAAVAENARSAGGAHVIVNGMESEPAAGKDKLLMRAVPHLVLDGAELAAAAVGARQITVCVHRESGMASGLRSAVAERAAQGWGIDMEIDVREAPRWYVSSESTALANFVDGGLAKPTSTRTYVAGVDGKPTLVANVETLAHLATIARYGPRWFRAVGTAEAPGTALFSIGGCVRASGVWELPNGLTGRDIIAAAGGLTANVQAVLVGGYGGTWISESNLSRPFTPEGLRPVAAGPGAGIVLVLPQGVCGLLETVRVVSWLASQNARQCGPCFNGLPAIADDLARVTWLGESAALDRLRFRLGVVDKRGACAHPNGAVKLVATALRVFDAHVGVHLRHRGCADLRKLPVFPLPRPMEPKEEHWR